MKNNCYNEESNIGNSILLGIIVLYIAYILFYILNVSLSGISYNYSMKIKDEEKSMISIKISDYLIDSVMQDVFKIGDTRSLNENIDKTNTLLFNEFKYIDIDGNNDNNKSNKSITNETEDVISKLNNDDNNNSSNDVKGIESNQSTKLTETINNSKLEGTSLDNEKREMISALNSKDESLKMTAISKMFTFETNIKVAQNLYDYADILNSTDNKIDLLNKKILIFHTHSQEGFKDTTDLKVNGIVGMGEELAKILREKYNLNVIHYTGEHDVTNGLLNREGSYERIEESIKEILKDDPDIEVLIDLHRDGVPESRRLVTNIDGKKCAQIMLVNGICKLVNNGKIEDIDYLPNDYIDDNLNLSMNMQIAADKLYPDISRRILVKPYRYSLHLKPNSMLIELGAQNNTVEEVKNTIPYLAEIIYTALTNKNDKL